MKPFSPSQYLNVTVGCPPSNGEKVMPIDIDFSKGGGVWGLDFTAIMQANKITSVQSMYWDNLANNSPITMLLETTGQRIDIPFESQGYMPLLMLSNNPKATLTCANTAIIIRFHFLNFYMPPYIWGAAIGSQ